MKLSVSIFTVASLLAISSATPISRNYVMDDCIKCQSVECIVSKMTFEEKIGQKMIPDVRSWSFGTCNATNILPVEQINDEISGFLAKYKFGGIVLFAQNTPETAQTVKLIDQFQTAHAATSKIPLLFTIDQEGGAVTRLGHGTMLPGNMALGATRNLQYAYDSGKVIGSELKSLGIQVNLGPVSDINTNPLNPVINVRSFGSDTSLVAKLALNYYNGVRSQGICACAKHFPGHGDTSKDSHFFLPQSNRTKEEINKNEFVPFKTLIDNGIDMIMTAHIQVPSLDNSLIPNQWGNDTLIPPATLSRKIMTDVLRGELGFQGVINSDAMNMDAIVTNFGKVYSARLAFRAGLDMIGMPATPTCLKDPEMAYYDQIIEGVRQDIKDGLYSMDELDASVIRILNLKKKYGILRYDGSKQEARITNALS
ncbi:hypothetical protein BB558_007392, partial [Smittium angustum]